MLLLFCVMRKISADKRSPAIEWPADQVERRPISDLLAFNRAYRQYLDNRQTMEMVHTWEVRDALQEASPQDSQFMLRRQ